ncbi:hypothetical protein, partial [Phormidium sp. CCY1219]|uniref:hypothetical protein n=1 Tax=Phormidium sp. CCY1219 TaxID=2886104 RepID=UPI002D1EC6EE
ISPACRHGLIIADAPFFCQEGRQLFQRLETEFFWRIAIRDNWITGRWDITDLSTEQMNKGY